jgi:Mrp family chromosome partitioning ATPase
LEKHYDLVVIDSPPALSFPEPLLIAPLTQGCLLVVESGKTGATALCRTVENLRAANANVLGVVVNKLRFRLFGRAELESLDYYGQNRKPQETEEGTQRKRKA